MFLYLRANSYFTYAPCSKWTFGEILWWIDYCQFQYNNNCTKQLIGITGKWSEIWLSLSQFSLNSPVNHTLKAPLVFFISNFRAAKRRPFIYVVQQCGVTWLFYLNFLSFKTNSQICRNRFPAQPLLMRLHGFTVHNGLRNYQPTVRKSPLPPP
jgi:hypothetical protein